MAAAADYYRTNVQRRGILGHISFGVRSYETSKQFYTEIFKPFGIELVFDDPVRKILGYGLDAQHEVFNIFERGEDATRQERTPILHSTLQVEPVWMRSSRRGFAMEARVMENLGYGRIMEKTIMQLFFLIQMAFDWKVFFRIQKGNYEPRPVWLSLTWHA